jgi:hypothetical protein
MSKGMMGGAYSDGWGLYQNPYGITGVTDNNTGSSFSGGTEHIMFGNPFKPVNPNGPSRDNSLIAAEYYASMPKGLSDMERATWLVNNPIENFQPTSPGVAVEQPMTPQEIVDKYFYGHGTPNATLQDTPAYINEGYDPTANAQPDPNITTSNPTGNNDDLTFGGESSVPANGGTDPVGTNPQPENPVDTNPQPENPNVDKRPIDWGDADFTSNYDPRGRSTPFLDSYIRSKEQAAAPGPVSGMMSKYME